MEFRLLLPLIAAISLAATTPARAQCTAEEMVSVLVLQNFDLPGPLTGEWVLEQLWVSPRGPITDPEESQIVAAINALNGTDCPQQAHGQVGDYRLYWGCGWDFITTALVDVRTGEVPFSGWVMWAGLGSIVAPAGSSHWLFPVVGPPADPPTTIATVPNTIWEFTNGAAEAVEALRETDLFHAYAACGDYEVTGYTYTPRVGYPDSEIEAAARLVLIVRGHLGPPWVPVSVEATTWSRVKSAYR